MKVLVPVQCPLTEVNVRAIERGRELAVEDEESELLIFHLNEIQKDGRVDRRSLREAVESSFAGIEASYIIRDGFFVEEAIIEAAIELGVERILLSTHRRNRWRQLLTTVLGLDDDLEVFLRNNTGIEVEVVTEPDTESTDT